MAKRKYKRLHYEDRPVSYTHLDVYKRQEHYRHRVLRNTGKDLERDKTECLISYSQSGCPAVRQREKIRLLVSSYGERQELNT